jgi:hypothetical protein
VANKFWKEIHGNQPKTVLPPPLALSSYSPIAKRSTQDTIPPSPSSLKRSWTDSEDAFWSETNSKTPNSAFNSRLFKAAQEEGIMSLEDELNSAAQKEANKPKPKLNPDMIAELKAKHRERFLDDSDSYKFA